MIVVMIFLGTKNLIRCLSVPNIVLEPQGTEVMKFGTEGRVVAYLTTAKVILNL